MRDRDQERMIAGPPQGLVPSSRGDPTGGRQNEQELFVGAPGQRPAIASGTGSVFRAMARAIAVSGAVGLR